MDHTENATAVSPPQSPAPEVPNELDTAHTGEPASSTPVAEPSSIEDLQATPTSPPQLDTSSVTMTASTDSTDSSPQVIARTTSSRSDTRPTSPTVSVTSSAHRRSFTMSKGNSVSVVLISSALETIASSKEAKKSQQLRESTQNALELIKANLAGDRPREVFEPLRIACETRNEKLMIASLDCISKLISYSFFAEPDSHSAYISPPPSPNPNRHVGSNGAHEPSAPPQPSLVDLVAHTITACHSDTTPDPVSLQIVKALLSLVLSPTILVHHSSLLKAIRTVYNVFLLSTDPVNQMVAQGGLTQMVHHVFTRSKNPEASPPSVDTPGVESASRSHSFPIPAPSRRSSSSDGPDAKQVLLTTASVTSLPLEDATRHQNGHAAEPSTTRLVSFLPSNSCP